MKEMPERTEGVIAARAVEVVPYSIEDLLRLSASMHKHLCPRQVLGVRMGLAVGRVLDLKLPQSGKRLLTIAETDGCTVDGISVVTNCWVGHRTLRIEDYGKIAATFVDTETRRAVRITPQSDVRERARLYAPPDCSNWESQLLGYRDMPESELLLVQEVELVIPFEQIISHKRFKAICDVCGEEVINEREIRRDGTTLCRACAGSAYYKIKQRANDVG
jgi:formylmethanofuran dehydrogenase subunit E